MGQRFSDYLKTHDRTKDLSSAEFARLVGIGKSAAADILAGRTTPPPRTLRKIADAFPDLPHSRLQELALLDTPVEISGLQRLNRKQRALIQALVDELVGTSEEESSLRRPAKRNAEASNVVQLPQPERVRKAAYDPPDE